MSRRMTKAFFVFLNKKKNLILTFVHEEDYYTGNSYLGEHL